MTKDKKDTLTMAATCQCHAWTDSSTLKTFIRQNWSQNYRPARYKYSRKARKQFNI